MPFNPLIHGTNSSVLAMLSHTDLTITSSINMLHKYKMGPLCGEIGDSLFGGGLSISADTYISFGRMNATKPNQYGLERVIDSYASVSIKSGQHALARFREKNQFTSTHGYEDINIMLIYLSRAKHLGASLDSEEHKQIVQNIEATIHYHYFLLLLVKYVRIDQDLLRNHVHQDRDFLQRVKKINDMLENPELAQKSYEPFASFMTYEQYINGLTNILAGTYDDIVDDIFEKHFKYEDIITAIIKNNIDLKGIYENPTQANLEKIISLIRSLAPLAIFTVDETPKQLNEPPRVDRRVLGEFYGLQRLVSHGHPKFIYRVLHKETIDMADTASFESHSVSRARTLEDKLGVLNDIVNDDAITFTPNEQQFIDKPFPIILICESEEKVPVFDECNQEYRAKGDLILGVDITMIATDIPAHQQAVMGFLAEKGINNVQVVLIEQLRQSQQNGERPVANPQSTKPSFVPAPLPLSISSVTNTC